MNTSVPPGGSGRIGEVDAYLVRPKDGDSRGSRSCAAILFWHWLDGEAPDGNRTEFRDEAAAMASLGVVSLLPQGRFPWTIDPSGAAADTAQIQLEVARLAAGLDALVALPEVDPGRIAVVGHDFGGMYAILATAADPRVRSLVVTAATPRWSDWFLPFWQIDEDRLDYLRATRSFDPIEQMAAISPRPVLLQFGQRDFDVAPMSAFGLRRAAGGDAVELKMYDAEHDMRHPDARSDRLAFLSRTLELEPPPSLCGAPRDWSTDRPSDKRSADSATVRRRMAYRSTEQRRKRRKRRFGPLPARCIVGWSISGPGARPGGRPGAL